MTIITIIISITITYPITIIIINIGRCGLRKLRAGALAEELHAHLTNEIGTPDNI